MYVYVYIFNLEGVCVRGAFTYSLDNDRTSLVFT